MKFQNCILINFVTDGRTSPVICPFNFSKVGGIKRLHPYQSRHLVNCFLSHDVASGSGMTPCNKID